MGRRIAYVSVDKDEIQNAELRVHFDENAVAGVNDEIAALNEIDEENMEIYPNKREPIPETLPVE